MNRPTTRSFHLHFNTPDVPAAERRLADLGLPLRNRFGLVDDDSVALDADDSVALDADHPVPDDFTLRLQTHQRGYVNVTLAPGRRPHFDHLGVCTSEFDPIVSRAAEAGWSVRDPEGRRPFVMTPWGFRVEVHPDGSDVESGLGDRAEAHLDEVRLAVAEPDEVRDGFSRVFGDVPELAVEKGERERPWVSTFRIEGDAAPVDVETDALLG